ncbi:butyrophilin subfamily 3 member A2-like [Spheniscus humboldti]
MLNLKWILWLLLFRNLVRFAPEVLLTDVLQNCKAMGSRYQQVTALHIIIFLQMIHSLTGQYKIIPPDKPVTGVIGKGVILPCQLNVKIIPERLYVQWIFTGNSKRIDVTTYDGKNTRNPAREDETYQGRTNFFQSEFNKGNMSLHLKNVMLSDKGKYTCSVFFENWYDEVVVDLNVAAKGDESSVFLDGHVGQGIGLTCCPGFRRDRVNFLPRSWYSAVFWI